MVPVSAAALPIIYGLKNTDYRTDINDIHILYLSKDFCVDSYFLCFLIRGYISIPCVFFGIPRERPVFGSRIQDRSRCGKFCFPDFVCILGA